MISPPSVKKRSCVHSGVLVEHRLCPALQRSSRRLAATSGNSSGKVLAALLPATLVDQRNRGEREKGILDEPIL